MKNVLQLLERAEREHPSKKAFIDEHGPITYRTLGNSARRVGSSLLSVCGTGKTVAIYLEKGINIIIAMMGIVYSGNIYAVIDTEMPAERVNKIFTSLEPEVIITDEKMKERVESICRGDSPVSDWERAVDICSSGEEAGSCFRKICLLENMIEADIDNFHLNKVRDKQTERDPLYVLYTSGSTGTPKGTVITHRNVLSYSEWFVDTFKIDENTVAGNQTPFYFSMSVTDIYSTLRACGTLVIIPAMCFSFPVKLMEWLNAYKVNMIYWVPSAFGIVANSRAFDYEKPKYLKKVLFAGEIMPAGYLRYWMRKLGITVLFANLYGPTETTDICTYYVVNEEINEKELLPIGRHCDNCDVFTVNSEGQIAKSDEEGELYVRGPFVSPGYYNDQEKTKEMFVQNPLNQSYPEICYRTGDLVRLNSRNEIIYLGRKDFQIKRAGYRIELGEIESAASCIDGVRECACVFEKESGKISLFYTADGVSEDDLRVLMAEKLNRYMMPDKYFRLHDMPHNQNGKVDRKELGRM